ncbi:methyltransferase domain-containing protein [Paenibacillus albidus]|uniref:methyltransferase domain-containing protein n=1 Tax=Paenibacillus albidus TaxID=2041023 RepID=UPI00166BC538|nr:methyltransferase domain-containing protein [Paenibacillus albidus]
MEVAKFQSFICSRGHCYDLSKYGTLNFSRREVKTKYDKRLFAARRAICQSGFYDPLYEIIGQRIAASGSGRPQGVRLLDAGCGEGSHLTAILDNIAGSTQTEPLGVGIDLSKEGIISAARAYRNSIWCVADLARCPFADKGFDFILNILSPSNYSEFHRMLSREGEVIKVIPGRDYLGELREQIRKPLNTQAYSNKRTLERFKDHFANMDVEHLRYSLPVSSSLLDSLLNMTPLLWGVEEEQVERIRVKGLQQITVDLTLLCGRLSI